MQIIAILVPPRLSCEALENKTMTSVFLAGGDECRGEVIEHDFIFLLLFPQCEPFVG